MCQISATHLATLVEELQWHPCANMRLYRYWLRAITRWTEVWPYVMVAKLTEQQPQRKDAISCPLIYTGVTASGEEQW